MYKRVRPSGESQRNCVALLWIEVGQSCRMSCSIPSLSHSFITYWLFKFAYLVSLFLGSITRSLNTSVLHPHIPFVTRYSVPYNFAFLVTFCMHCPSAFPLIFLPPSYVFLSAPLFSNTCHLCCYPKGRPVFMPIRNSSGKVRVFWL